MNRPNPRVPKQKVSHNLRIKCTQDWEEMFDVSFQAFKTDGLKYLDTFKYVRGCIKMNKKWMTIYSKISHRAVNFLITLKNVILK